MLKPVAVTAKKKTAIQPLHRRVHRSVAVRVGRGGAEQGAHVPALRQDGGQEEQEHRRPTLLLDGWRRGSAKRRRASAVAWPSRTPSCRARQADGRRVSAAAADSVRPDRRGSREDGVLPGGPRRATPSSICRSWRASRGCARRPNSSRCSPGPGPAARCTGPSSPGTRASA